MDYQSRQLAEDFFLREPVDARIRYVKICVYIELCNTFSSYIICEISLFSYSKARPEPEEEPHPSLKVEMQTVRLNPDSQKLVLDTLRFIHGPSFKLGSASVYKVFTDLKIYSLVNNIILSLYIEIKRNLFHNI